MDIALFAQLALVLDTSLPAPLLCDLLLDEYPTLVSHHERMLEAFPDGWKGVQRLPAPPAPTLWSTLSGALPWSSASSSSASVPASTDGESKSKDERRKEAAQLRKFRYARWAWFAGAGLALVTYVLASGLVDISFDDVNEEDEDDEEEEDEWVVEEEVDGEGEGEGGQAPTDLYAFMGYRGGGLPVADDDDEEEETAAE